jgi:mitochondrial fission protein ELM1
VIDRLCDDLATLCQARRRRADGHDLAPHRVRRTRPSCARSWPACRPFSGTAAGDNPYYGFLGLADFIVVTTGDSVNMASEALVSGKPVHVAHLDGGTAKFRRFHADLEREGLAQPVQGRAGILDLTRRSTTHRRAAAEARQAAGSLTIGATNQFSCQLNSI